MIENKIRRLLVDGEDVILSDSIGDGKLVLTSRKLFICGAKGLFSRDYVIKKEVELKDIAEVRGDLGNASITGVIGNSRLLVLPKGGQWWDCQFMIGSMLLLDFNTAQTMSMSKVNNWVSAINKELLKFAKG